MTESEIKKYSEEIIKETKEYYDILKKVNERLIYVSEGNYFIFYGERKHSCIFNIYKINNLFTDIDTCAFTEITYDRRTLKLTATPITASIKSLCLDIIENNYIRISSYEAETLIKEAIDNNLSR